MLKQLREAGFSRNLIYHGYHVLQAYVQVCLHSHGHGAQCAKLLRKHGGVPPQTDFILWLAGRPEAEWPAALSEEPPS